MLLQFVSKSKDIVNETFSAIAPPTEITGVSTKYIRTLGDDELTDSLYPIFLHGASGELAPPEDELFQRATALLTLPLRAVPTWQFHGAPGSAVGDDIIEAKRGAIARVVGSSAAEHECSPLVVLDEFLPGCRRMQDEATVAVLYLTGPNQGTFSRYPHVKANLLINVKSSAAKVRASLTKELSDWEQKRDTMLQTRSKHSIVFPVRDLQGASQVDSQGASQSSSIAEKTAALAAAEEAMRALDEAKKMAKQAAKDSADLVSAPVKD